MEVTLLFIAVSILAGASCSLTSEYEKRSPEHLGIYHGNTTSIGRFPFVVSVVLSPEEFLVGTGVVLDKNWVLSTAYVASEFGYDRTVLRVGSSRWNSGGQTVRVVQTVLHPNYTGDWNYDVAVLKTDKPIKLGKKVKPATLGTVKLAADTQGVVMGWGPPNEREIAPTKWLKLAQNTVLDDGSCKTQYPDDYGVSLFCSKLEREGPCAGDFGSPLVRNGAVYGLYAGADNCAEALRVYTNIPLVAEWVKEAIKSVSFVTHADNLVGTGVIRNENWILTSGYVVAAHSVEKPTIRAGSNKWDQPGQIVFPYHYVIHPKYNMRWAYDVAVFRVNPPLKLGKKVQAIQLGTENLVPETVGEVLGWGPTSEASTSPSKVLRAANNTVWDSKSCKKVYSHDDEASVFCVQPEEAGPCAEADNGSPLVVNGKVYGLFAGYSGAFNSTSRLYANIPVVAKWIKTTINQ